jgi:hypothetical protein
MSSSAAGGAGGGGGWYPGKFIKERRASTKVAKSEKLQASVEGRNVSSYESVDGSSQGSLHRLPSGDVTQGSSSPLASHGRKGKAVEKPVGQLSVKILDVKYPHVTKPALEVFIIL